MTGAKLSPIAQGPLGKGSRCQHVLEPLQLILTSRWAPNHWVGWMRCVAITVTAQTVASLEMVLLCFWGPGGGCELTKFKTRISTKEKLRIRAWHSDPQTCLLSAAPDSDSVHLALLCIMAALCMNLVSANACDCLVTWFHVYLLTFFLDAHQRHCWGWAGYSPDWTGCLRSAVPCLWVSRFWN